MLLVRTVIVLLLGLATGSFLNVIIDRIPRSLSIFGRSYCDHCKRTLGILDLIPLFSFLFLGGRCRYCKEKINIRNPVVEILTGMLLILTFLYLSPTSLIDYIEFLYYLVVVSGLIAILFVDLKERIIPDKITYPIILLTFLYLIFNKHLFLNHFLSGLGASIFFLLLFISTRGKGLGFGDVKLAALLGLFLGFSKVIVAIYAAFLTGAAASVILILWRKKTLRDKIAFGPFLVLGGLIAYFLGDRVVSLWLNFL